MRSGLVRTALPLLGAAGLASCGAASEADDPPRASRAPQQQLITVSLVGSTVRVSPAKVDGGPVRLLVANESAASTTLSIGRGGGEDPPARRELKPRGITQIQTTLRQGTYTLRSVGASGGTASGRLRVGADGPSADSQTRLP